MSHTFCFEVSQTQVFAPLFLLCFGFVLMRNRRDVFGKESKIDQQFSLNEIHCLSLTSNSLESFAAGLDPNSIESVLFLVFLTNRGESSEKEKSQ
mmetsp:Transcript_301/g.333  ORF Transcript_301/g.333 Transcript_301/m.333 type:complete len:95 (+) Transcript_301:111-395(+)